jgi:hypothetical protein
VTEDEWLSRVLDTAQLHGWRVQHVRPARTVRGWRTPVQGDQGAPDLLLARAGRVLLVELKSDRGRLGPGQREWLAAAGGHARLWRPRDWVQVLAELGNSAR